jgi:hypothetical protein
MPDAKPRRALRAVRVEFEDAIRAPRQHAGRVVRDDGAFRHRCARFGERSPRSHEGPRGRAIRFIDTRGNGPLSRVLANWPVEILSVRHARSLRAWGRMAASSQRPGIEGT